MASDNALVPTVSRSGEALRRLSSHNATEAELHHRSPMVVVPPKHLLNPGDAHETAAAMEFARRELEEFASPLSTPASPMETSVTDKYAFAFDIDGVLIRGGRAIPEAIEAMRVLNGKNAYGIKM